MDVLRVGHGRECITPPLGIKMAGYGARTEGAADVHDDLFLNAVVLESQDDKVALLTYDLCGLNAEMVAEIKSAIREDIGLEPEQILLNWSHTHAGPSLGRKEPDETQKGYRSDLTRKSVRVLGAALEDTAPATLSAGVAPVDIGCNRRERFEDGRVWLGVNPEGPALHEMTVWLFARQDKPDVILFSTAMHGTTLGGKNLRLSAEWMGSAVRNLESERADVRAIFLQGCGGDQNPYASVIDNVRGTFEEIEQHGRDAADAVRQALQQMRQLDPLPLRSVARTAELPPKEEDGEPQQLPLHGIRLGQAMLMGIGCEAFVEYALFGREISPAEETLVLGYSDGGAGYLPTADAYEEGGYEVKTTRVAPEAEEIAKEAMRKVFDELAR